MVELRIENLVTVQDLKNKTIWFKDLYGEFSSSNYFNQIRSRGNNWNLANWIWKKCVHPSLAARIRKISQKPVQLRVEFKGVVLP